MILLSALFALGVGLAGSAPASAAPISGLSTTGLTSQSMIEDIQYYRSDRRCRRPYCRSVRVCHRYYRRVRCRIERVCRR